MTGHTGRVWSCAWHPAGDLLASCGEDKTVRLWAGLGDGWECKTVLTEGHTRAIRRVAWSPCGNYLATASFDGTVAIWDKRSGQFECGASLEGHENEVKCVAWSPGGEFLATCSRDKSVWLWDVDYDDDEYSCASVLHSHTQDVKVDCLTLRKKQNYIPIRPLHGIQSFPSSPVAVMTTTSGCTKRMETTGLASPH